MKRIATRTAQTILACLATTTINYYSGSLMVALAFVGVATAVITWGTE